MSRCQREKEGNCSAELNTYYICLLRKGPKWISEETPELEELQAQHMAHISELIRSGAKLFAGPVDDESDIRGFSIFRTAPLAEAQALAGLTRRCRRAGSSRSCMRGAHQPGVSCRHRWLEVRQGDNIVCRAST